MKAFFQCMLLVVITYASDLQAQQPELQRVQSQIFSARRATLPAMVLINADSNSQRRQGVLISSDGLILVMGRSHSQWHGPQPVLLSDGRKVTARALEFSQEWRIQLLQIEDEGKWPRVELASASAQVGQICFALDYSDSFGLGKDIVPTMRLGCIDQSGPGWFVSSCEFGNSGGSGAGTFNLNGELIGLTTRRKKESEIQTDATVINRLIDQLRKPEGINVEHLRSVAFPKALPPSIASNLKTAIAASVRIRHGSNPKHNFSGTIVNKSGLIVSCAHHNIPSGGRVDVELTDGRNVPGEILGANRVTDLCLVQIDGDGPWPYAPIGNSFDLQVNDPVTILGYPHGNDARTPTFKNTKRIEVEGRPECCLLFTEGGQIRGGMSGGGVFDTKGRLVAIHHGRDSQSGFQGRVETFFQQWDTLYVKKHAPEGLEKGCSELQSRSVAIADKVTPAVVEIWSGKTRIAFGIVVDADGEVLTKASELKEPIRCRSVSGIEYPASIIKVSREHDLALLNIEATGLQTIQFGKEANVVPGTLATIALPDRNTEIGVVAHGKQAIASDPGILPFLLSDIEETKDGLKLIDDEWIRTARVTGKVNIPLKKGDEIVAFSDHVLLEQPKWRKLSKPMAVKQLGTAGDPVHLRVRRGGRELNLSFPLSGTMFPQPIGTNARSSSFAAAFDIAVPLSMSDCGAPVINLDGNCIGMVVARRTRGRIYVTDSDSIRKFCGF